MAVFNPIVITTAGISLLSQAMAGKGTLTFTSVATSTTVIPYNISNIQARTALSGIVQTVVPVSVVLKTGNVQVSSIFNNAGITNAYTANTIGLYAALGNGAQTLFAVAIATTPDNIPVQNDLSPSNFYYQFNIAISDTSQLTVTVPEDGSLPASVFNQMFPGITAPDQNNDGDALVYNASSGAWGYVNTETVFTTVSGSGEFVSLQKTLADDFKQIQLFGKSVQKPTTGVQLFNINKLKELDDGVEIIDYSTGEMEISQQNNAMLPVRLSDICPNMVEGQTYYLTGETTSNNKYLRVGAKQWNFDEALVLEESDLLAQCNFECTTQTEQSGETIYYKDTFKNIMIVEGSTKKPYEVYTGGEPATEPSPEYPLPITSAGNYNAESEKYEIGVFVQTFNLFTGFIKGKGLNSDNGNIGAKKNSAITDYILVNFDENSNIYISGITNKLRSYVAFYDKDKKYVGRTGGMDNTAIDLLKGQSLNTGVKINGVGYMILTQYCVETSVGTIDEIDTINVMINYEKKAEYQPYDTQREVTQLPNPFRGIPVDSGGNYTDSDGQQWICDYIDRERGKYVQCVQEIVFDGSDDEKWSTYDGAVYLGFKIALPKGKFDNRTIGMCDRFKNTGSTPVSSLATSIFYPNNFDGIMYITFDSDLFLDVSEFKEWLKSNQTKVVYPIGAQIEIDLTQEQLSALDLFAYQGITNIGTDTMPQVGVEVESQGFNLAGDLAQNLIDLQTTVQTQAGEIETLQNTVQSQGTAIVANTTKLAKMGLIDYSNNTSAQNSNSLSVLDSSNKNLLAANATYLVYISTKISEGSPTERSYLPTLEIIYSDSDNALVEGTPVYLAQARTQTPFGCTFMFRTNSTLPESINFYIDDDTHQFLGSASVIYRID